MPPTDTAKRFIRGFLCVYLSKKGNSCLIRKARENAVRPTTVGPNLYTSGGEVTQVCMNNPEGRCSWTEGTVLACLDEGELDGQSCCRVDGRGRARTEVEERSETGAWASEPPTATSSTADARGRFNFWNNHEVRERVGDQEQGPRPQKFNNTTSLTITVGVFWETRKKLITIRHCRDREGADGIRDGGIWESSQLPTLVMGVVEVNAAAAAYAIPNCLDWRGVDAAGHN
ncbi:hypothetical protein EDD17DRAFT_1513602 [Pisolithus thermaeus]|nr:hypothetical protein EV401DRAFT_2202998 [Pisolithus croceorrhizus]KAI6150139.1 hypothetical protein EDD17DRAFT_1513602 [Pisolithus thermaeus]